MIPACETRSAPPFRCAAKPEWRASSRRCPARVGVLGLLALGLLLAAPTQASDLQDRRGLLAAHGFKQQTYYRVVRPDPRLCPSPLCGGLFVERVLLPLTRCADGSRADECYAGLVDFSALDLSPSEEAELLADFVDKRAIVRGALVEVDSVFGFRVPTLVVADAWRGVTGTQAEPGRYFGVIPSGIVCITHPCPSLLALPLNTKLVGWLHSVDLGSESGATSEQIGEGLDALYSGSGLILFGRRQRIVGPAGVGRELVASEFYTEVSPGGPAACGGFTYPRNPPCDEREFCEQPAGMCLVLDLPGTCQPIPDACPAVVDPVCGCDGSTYGNDCERQRARVALDHPGPCSGVPPQACGPVVCSEGTVCCNPLHGICTPPGGICLF